MYNIEVVTTNDTGGVDLKDGRQRAMALSRFWDMIRDRLALHYPDAKVVIADGINDRVMVYDSEWYPIHGKEEDIVRALVDSAWVDWLDTLEVDA